MQPSQIQVIFIRHGESTYNKEAEELRNKLKIGATWEQYKANPQFLEFKYNEKVLDCDLSEHGKQQCAKLKGQFDDADLIIVSPLFRALQSCSIICENIMESGKIIVEPLFAESLRCACDVSMQLPRAKKQWPHFDYTPIKGIESSWYILNQSPQKQKLYEGEMLKSNAKTYEERGRCINQYLKQTHNFEDAYDLINRAKRCKQKLKQYALDRECKKIVVISHYYTISYIVSDSFNQKGKPVPSINIGNASPYCYRISMEQ